MGHFGIGMHIHASGLSLSQPFWGILATLVYDSASERTLERGPPIWVVFRETETTGEKVAKNVQDITKKIGIDSEKLMDDAEKLFEKAKKYEFTQTPEGKEINGLW